MSRPATVWLVRHGPIDVEYGVCVGSTDVPLATSEDAFARARAIAKLIRHADATYTSDSRRAYDTAQAIAAVVNTPLEATPELRELNFGAWEMRAWSRSEHEDPEQYARFMADWRNVRAPGGESYHDLATRVRNFWQRAAARHSGGTIIVVGHGGSLRTLAAMLLSTPADEAMFMPFARGHVAMIRPATGRRALDIDPFAPGSLAIPTFEA